MPKVIDGKSQMSDNEKLLTNRNTTDTSILKEMCFL